MPSMPKHSLRSLHAYLARRKSNASQAAALASNSKALAGRAVSAHAKALRAARAKSIHAWLKRGASLSAMTATT
eukprot:6731483-Lingulodinium_polyedra.AAC.1